MHLMAYSGTVTAATNNVDVAALLDQVLVRQNSHFILPRDRRLLWAYAFGTDLNRVRFNYPRLRQLFLPFLTPLDIVSLPIQRANVAWFLDNNMILAGNEELAVEATQDNVADQTATILVATAEENIQAEPGPCYTIRATASITTVANTWTLGALSLSETLPGGEYAVIGMSAHQATCKAARLVFNGQVERPGCPAGATLNLNMGDKFRRGGLGVWGRFLNTQVPQVEVLNTGAGATTPTFFLDLVKVA